MRRIINKKRHAQMLEKAMSVNPKRFMGIDYRGWEDKGQDYIYFEGSNDPSDWAYNFAAVGIIYHLGYYLKARKAKKLLKQLNLANPVILGHSHGAGIVSVLAIIAKDYFSEAIAFGSPPAYGKLNFFKPKNFIHYLIAGDAVIGSSIAAFAFHKIPRPVKILKTGEAGIKEHMVSSYIEALKNG